MPGETLYRTILELHGLEYAICDAANRVYEFSAGFARYVNRVSGPLRGQRLEDLLDELTGAEADLKAIQAGTLPLLKIEKVHRTLPDHRQGYITITIAPLLPELLIIITDVTSEGALEQRITQQRNELDLLTGQLAAARAQLDDLLHRFVPSSVADQVVAAPSSIRLGGERREISVLFADMRGFTSLSEVQTPEAMLDLLNGHFRTLGSSLVEHGGTISQYAGDMIMAIFNAPLVQPDHAQRAVQAALALQAMLSRLRLKPAPEATQPTMNFGVGINTGPAVVGYLGFEERFEYTAIGEAVNVASRLSNAAQGRQVLVGEQTYRELEGQFQARFIGALQLKGKRHPVNTYEILGLHL